MNILILNWRDPKNPKSGGAERVTLGHGREWIKKGHKVTWFTSRFSGSIDHEIFEGVEIIRKGTEFTIFFYAPIFYFFSNKKFDVIIDEIHGIPFFTPLFINKPKIAFIHEVAREIWDYMYPFPLNIIGRLSEHVYFLLYRNIPFWTDANSTIEDLTKFSINKSAITVIPCPIDNAILKKLPQKADDPTFIFVSRIVKMKGIEDIIEAFRILHIQYSKSKLWIVGDGDKLYIESIKKTVKSNNLNESVIFYGKVSEERKLELMSRSHLLLHASVREGWGLVVLEAASQGTPSVTYNVSGLRDTVRDGITGILTKKNTPSDLAESTLSLLRDHNRYLKFQNNCLDFAKSITWEDVGQKSIELLIRVIKYKNQ